MRLTPAEIAAIKAAARDAFGDVARVDLEPARIGVLVAAQRGEQRAIAAADIEHAAARRDVGGEAGG